MLNGENYEDQSDRYILAGLQCTLQKWGRGLSDDLGQ